MSGGNARLLSNIVDAQSLVQTAQSTHTQSKVSRLPTAPTSTSSSCTMGVINPVHAARTDSRTNQNSFAGSKQSHAASSINDPSSSSNGSSSSGSGSNNVYGEYHERASNTYAVLIRDELNQLVSSLRNTEKSSMISSGHTVNDIDEPISAERGSEEGTDKELEKEHGSGNDIDKIIIKQVLQSIVDIVSSRCDVGVGVGVVVDEVELSSEGGVTGSGNHAPIPAASSSSPSSSPVSSTSTNFTALSASSIALSPTSTTLPLSDAIADSALLPLPFPTAIATYWGHADLSDPVNGHHAATASTFSPSSSSSSSSSSAAAAGANGSASPPRSSSSLTSLPLTSSQSSHSEINLQEHSSSTPVLESDSTSNLPETSRILYGRTDLSMMEEVELIESERRRGKITLLDHLYLQDECGLGLYVLCDSVSDRVFQYDPPSCTKPEDLTANLCGLPVSSLDDEMCVRDGCVEKVEESSGLVSVVIEKVEEGLEEVANEMVEQEVNEGVEEKVEEEVADAKMDTSVSAGLDINDKAVYVEEDEKKNESENAGMGQIEESEVREDVIEMVVEEILEKKEEEQEIDDNEKSTEVVENDMNVNVDVDVNIDVKMDVDRDVNVDVNADMNGCYAEVVKSATDADLNPQSQEAPLHSRSQSPLPSLSATASSNVLNIQSDQSKDFIEDVIEVSNSYDIKDTYVQEKESLENGNTCSDTQPSSPTPHASTYWKDTSYVPINSKSILVRVGDSLSQRAFPGTVLQPSVTTKVSRVTAAEAKLKSIQKLEENLEKNLKYSKKRKKIKEKERKKEKNVIENAFNDSPVPKKVPRLSVDNNVPLHVDHKNLPSSLPSLPSIPSSLPLSVNIQKYTANFTIEKYSFFDQVCSFYEKKKKELKLIGTILLFFECYSSVSFCVVFNFNSNLYSNFNFNNNFNHTFCMNIKRLQKVSSSLLIV